MTRNEWIAETAREYNIHGKRRHGGRTVYHCFEDALEAAAVDAVAVDASGYSPWTTPAPALTDTAAKVVEAAEAWWDSVDTSNQARKTHELAAAVRAHLAAKQGGAK